MKWRRLLLVLWLAGLLLPPALVAGRLVAVADIHGDLEAFVGILQKADLIDDNQRWSGGDAVLVQTGDFLDRGEQVLAVVGLLRRLQVEAEAAGGQVIVLMGNHEAMNVLGITRDVSPAVFEQLVDGDSERRRQEAFSGYEAWYRSWAQERGLQAAEESALEEEWMASHPPGLLEYLEIVSKEDDIGRWLRSLPTITTLEGVTFLHAGLSPALVAWSDEEINDRVWQEIERFDRCRNQLIADGTIHESTDTVTMASEGLTELRAILSELQGKVPRARRRRLEERADVLKKCVDYREWFLVKEDGPLWYRGFARVAEEAGQPSVEELLRRRQSARFFVGHTPRQGGRIETRFDKRVILADTGMLSEVYGGRASALEINGRQTRLIYPDGAEAIELDRGPPPARYGVYSAADGSPLPFTEEASVVEFLKQARVVSSERIPQGVNKPLKVLLEHEGIQAYAVFRRVDLEDKNQRLQNGRLVGVLRDNYRYEAAAYFLSEYLGIKRVPPAVLRTVDGDEGSMQIFLHNVMTEQDRREKGLEAPEPADWLQQKLIMHFFDALIQNVDRNQGNILIGRDSWKLWLIDHTRSFLEDSAIPNLSTLRQCERSIWGRFRNYDEDEVRAALKPILRAYELEALFDRWQQLIDHFEAEIAEHGEAGVLFNLSTS